MPPIYKFCTKRCQETKVFLKEICHESHTFLTYFFLFVSAVEGMNFERPLVTDMNPSAGGPRYGNGWRGDENEDTMEVS